MAFRELRDFTEYMRVLGYPRLVSVDNFRTPNFPLVADILYWMVHKYDPAVSISDDISTEDCRVDFLTSIAQVMAVKATVKLNTKRLYAADGKAVKELLKVAKLLYAAHEANVGGHDENREGKGGEEDVPETGEASYNQLHARLPDVKATRRLASQITESGAKLFDLLHDERELSVERQRCLRFLDGISNNLDSGAEHKLVEKRLEQLLDSAKENVAAMEKQCQDLASDEKTLQVKIKKRQGELERNDKRLKSLQSVRPAFMDEYEKLESELEKMYEVYMEKFRNLDYLEHRLEQFSQRDREKVEQAERARKRIQVSIMEKKARDLRGDEDDHLYPDDDEHDEEEHREASGTGPGGSSGSARPGSRGSRKGMSDRALGGHAGNNARRSAGADDDDSEISGISDVSDDDGSSSSDLTGSLSDGDNNGDGDLIEDGDDDSDEDSVSDSDLSDDDDAGGLHDDDDDDASDLDDSDDNF
ncbi:Clusterin-associated protein 1-like [Hondaea fermentalgiana]|uniref:Clusterin-associated protein 1-like n=1 Tax=Hondaea fermentalgiana TaxID=2315210 RepID=A0A2R5GT02_9STRA|nr:Clusterin-associated protein 1-like [Hondaea fermentalgiana]|eukprot:GBG33970.1 Clusterin-associated protein 1-like [Hondaea fermentalgiana]